MNANEIPGAHPELLDALHRQDEQAREMKLSEGFTEKVMEKIKSTPQHSSVFVDALAPLRAAKARSTFHSSLFTFHFSLRRIAAIFLAAAFLGGLAFGAYRAFSPAKETPTEEKDSSLFILHSSLPSPVRFSDIRLDSILTVVSAHYGKAVSFRNEEAKGLKFIMAWNPDSSLTSFIDGLNMFDGLLLTLQQDTIFVETTEVREGAE